MVDTDTTPEEQEQARKHTEAVERQLKEAPEEIATLKAASSLSDAHVEQLLSVLSVAPGNVSAVDEIRAHIAALHASIEAISAAQESTNRILLETRWDRNALEDEVRRLKNTLFCTESANKIAVADNAALLAELGLYLDEHDAEEGPDLLATLESIREVAARPHPGAALLAEHAKELARVKSEADSARCALANVERSLMEIGVPPNVATAPWDKVKWLATEHAKALVLARNEGLEKAAEYMDANGMWAPESERGQHAEAIRAMKEPEP